MPDDLRARHSGGTFFFMMDLLQRQGMDWGASKKMPAIRPDMCLHIAQWVSVQCPSVIAPYVVAARRHFLLHAGFAATARHGLGGFEEDARHPARCVPTHCAMGFGAMPFGYCTLRVAVARGLRGHCTGCFAPPISPDAERSSCLAPRRHFLLHGEFAATARHGLGASKKTPAIRPDVCPHIAQWVSVQCPSVIAPYVAAPGGTFFFTVSFLQRQGMDWVLASKKTPAIPPDVCRHIAQWVSVQCPSVIAPYVVAPRRHFLLHGGFAATAKHGLGWLL
ncbi:hypothetical protein [Uliginosibacterium flavum]|uniref:Uncharacterized protein n=1 Tax=Uliginosibacterium flavum TaxID=1396831 RepID=A0ABV2TJ64_9RHOO